MLKTVMAAASSIGLLLALVPGARAERFAAPASVIDGDTIQVSGTLIQLMDIDAPGRDQFCVQAAGDAAWRCGEDAAIALLNLVGTAVVTCESEGLDQFNRHLARCTVAGQDVAVALADNGWAVPNKDCACEAVRAATLRAQAAGLGIWTGPFALPWERPAVYYLGDFQD
jgi:endonuclease YncB( thermonuclease family)